MSQPEPADLDDELAERVAAANAALVKLAAQYRDWALNDLAQMREALAQVQEALAKGDGETERAALYKIYDLSHNAKGQGAYFGYELVTRIGASLSALLVNAKSASPELIERAAAHFDALDAVLNQNLKGDQGERGVMLLRRHGIGAPAAA